MSPLLDIQELVVDYNLKDRRLRAVDHVSFAIEPGEIVGLCGESGCGKSTVAHAILRVLRPPAQFTSGRIMFGDADVASLGGEQLRAFRWRHASLVFQSAMNALNPVITIGDHFVDVIKAHHPTGTRDARTRAGELLTMVGIDPSRLNSYPHELSGGMRQRVVIALAISLQPELIIMDEPTTALDVVLQRQIMQQIASLQTELGFAVLFITHDLSMLIEFAQRIGVMYAGKLVELSDAKMLFRKPKHPYTVGLMSSFPPLTGPKKLMYGIPGSPPNLANPPSGCRFHPRCVYHDPSRPALFDRQSTRVPTLREIEPGHWVACHLYDADFAEQGIHGLDTVIEAVNPDLPPVISEEVGYAG